MNGKPLQTAVNAILTAGMIGGIGWLWQVNAELAGIQIQLKITNERTAEILATIDRIAPRPSVQ